jgi:hypothetical protein
MKKRNKEEILDCIELPVTTAGQLQRYLVGEVEA